MLPFLKKNKDSLAGGIMTKMRAPDEKSAEQLEKENSNEDDPAAAIEACAKDLIMAVHSHDIKGAAEAMKAAFEILESTPHEEAEHNNAPSPHSYDAQNIKAAE